MSNLPLHIFIFAADNYQDLVSHCAKSIEKFVNHPLITKNIVSNTAINLPGWRTILDHDFWDLLDPDGINKNIYRINHVKQQIFKMSLDRYVQGMLLVVDAEVLFLRKTTMGFLDKQYLYGNKNRPSSPPHYKFTEELCNIKQQTNFGFITDQMMYSTDTLIEIQKKIEEIHGVSWITVCQRFIDQSSNKINGSLYSFSEFELIANFLLFHYQDRIEIKDINQHSILMPNRQTFEFDELIQMLSARYQQDFISVNIDNKSYSNNNNAWLTFYYSIKDSSWPDCWSESDFKNLPDHVQKECIETFHYTPFNNLS
jgi:hypothetical protein